MNSITESQDYINFCIEYKLNPNLAMSLGIYYAIKDKYKNNTKIKVRK